MLVRLADLRVRDWIGVVRNSAVGVLFDTAFTEHCIRGIFPGRCRWSSGTPEQGRYCSLCKRESCYSRTLRLKSRTGISCKIEWLLLLQRKRGITPLSRILLNQDAQAHESCSKLYMVGRGPSSRGYSPQWYWMVMSNNFQMNHVYNPWVLFYNDISSMSIKVVLVHNHMIVAPVANTATGIVQEKKTTITTRRRLIFWY